MQSNIAKRLEKIVIELGKISTFSRSIMKYGFQAFAAILTLGTLMLAYNQIFLGFDLYFQLTAINLIKNSFIVLAEVIIGSLLIDYILKKV